MEQKSSYNRDELLACGRGEMFGEKQRQTAIAKYADDGSRYTDQR